MTLTPTSPDEARAAMPHSAVQPLPLYLRPDFQPFLDRDRPHQLLAGPYNLAKPLPPERRVHLQYRYLDNNETVVVPNIWYNQTVEMRLKGWSFEVQRLTANVAATKADLAKALACKERFYRDTPIERYLRNLTDYLRQTEENLAKCQQILLDVTHGVRFL